MIILMTMAMVIAMLIVNIDDNNSCRIIIMIIHVE